MIPGAGRCPVGHGYQAVFRAKDIRGPYEHRVVLDEGDTSINGPHQGAWVDTPTGEDWFLHFQDLRPYGRVVHLEPMTWRADDWPVIGAAAPGAEKGEPVVGGSGRTALLVGRARSRRI